MLIGLVAQETRADPLSMRGGAPQSIFGRVPSEHVKLERAHLVPFGNFNSPEKS